MRIHKRRWSKVYESSEEELLAFLQARQVMAERWTLDEFDVRSLARQPDALELYLAEGSANLTVGPAKVSLQPGDVLTIPAGSDATVTAGMSGCVCYQAAASSS